MLMKRIPKGLSLICAVLAFSAIAVEAQIPSIQEQLALAEAKWSTNKPKTYEFTLKIICFCPPSALLRIFLRGKPTGVGKSTPRKALSHPLNSDRLASF